jgi:fucose 4-O-acetylase-like acetyltransferase
MAERLLVPYAFFNILSYMLWLLRVEFLDNPQEVHILRPLIGILYGNGNDFWMIHNTPLWFFVCLFIAQVMFFLILKIAKLKMQIVMLLFIFAAIGYLDSKYLKFRLPWSIDIALTAVVFSGIGYIFKGYRWELSKNKRIALMSIVLLLNVCISFFNGKIDMNYNKYNNIFLFYCGALSGIFFWANASVMIKNSKILRYIGNNSLTIFALHIPVLIIIVKLLMMIDIPYSTQESHISFLFIHAFLTILAIIPLNYLLNKYVPFLVGRRNLKQP